MLQLLLLAFSHAINRIHTPIILAAAVVGLLIGLVGARFSRSIISLTLVSAGTIVGLQMPRWFGWGIDPMGTAFGAAIVLGLSGYILSTLWEGILLTTLLAAICGVGVWLKLAPLGVWHRPHIDFSQTATEISYAVWQSLPVAVNRALPLAIGVGATIGTLLMVFTPRLGRVLFYAFLGTSLFVCAALLGVDQMRPEWLSNIPQDCWIQGAIFGLAVIFAAGIQWIFLPKTTNGQPAPRSDKNSASNRFVANGPALQVQSRGSGFGTSSSPKPPSQLRPRKIPSRIM